MVIGHLLTYALLMSHGCFIVQPYSSRGKSRVTHASVIPTGLAVSEYRSSALHWVLGGLALILAKFVGLSDALAVLIVLPLFPIYSNCNSFLKPSVVVYSASVCGFLLLSHALLSACLVHLFGVMVREVLIAPTSFAYFGVGQVVAQAQVVSRLPESDDSSATDLNRVRIGFGDFSVDWELYFAVDLACLINARLVPGYRLAYIALYVSAYCRDLSILVERCR